VKKKEKNGGGILMDFNAALMLLWESCLDGMNTRVYRWNIAVQKFRGRQSK